MIRILNLYLDLYFLLLSPRSWLITITCLQNTKMPVRQEEMYNGVRSWKENGPIQSQQRSMTAINCPKQGQPGQEGEREELEGLAQGTGLMSRGMGLSISFSGDTQDHQYGTKDKEANMFSEPWERMCPPGLPHPATSVPFRAVM